ncbi:SAM-dependent methyltransferase, partial [Chroococcidiopsis cubana CCALA 043]
MGDLPGLDLDTLNEWRSFASRDPNPDEFLYRRLLMAQCKALAEGIPALFDTRQNYQALFLPGNLLNQDSIVRRLVKEIPEEDWQDIEVVGWLYQFYISERKDEVIGAKSKVSAADIPAATQLFTPHWIVRYMVENSLGGLWLEAHPESKLREHMPYYLENPNNSSGENEDLRSLTPQDLTAIDPACGSGHILVYAFDLLFEIYKEQGYLERDIPALILTHNLYGLDIDERAAQLASFAVLMKARAKNSRILRQPPALNITAVRPTHSQTLPPAAELKAEDWEPLVEAFKNADNLGSLITPPPFDAQKLKAQLEKLENSDRNPLFREYVPALRGLLLQAELLSKQYWVVVANPPYMGSGSFNDVVKKFVNTNYQNSKSDLFAVFMELGIKMAVDTGFMATINQQSWMFLSSYENLRKELLTKYTIESMVHLGARAFPEIGGEVVQSTTFVLSKQSPQDRTGNYVRLVNYNSAESKEKKYLSGEHRYFGVNQADFAKIPGSTIAYWASNRVLEIFGQAENIKKYAQPCVGLFTCNNQRFLRFWYEINIKLFGINLSKETVNSFCLKWFPYNKGGEFRKWYGNNDYVVNYQNNGREIRKYRVESGQSYSLPGEAFYFQEGITWSFVSSSYFGVRYSGKGFIFDVGGSSAFPNEDIINSFTGFLCSNVAFEFMKIMNPTLNFQVGNVANLPVIESLKKPINYELAGQAINISCQDWDNFETSWDFPTHPLLRHNTKHLSEAFT